MLRSKPKKENIENNNELAPTKPYISFPRYKSNTELRVREFLGEDNNHTFQKAAHQIRITTNSQLTSFERYPTKSRQFKLNIQNIFFKEKGSDDIAEHEMDKPGHTQSTTSSQTDFSFSIHTKQRVTLFSNYLEEDKQQLCYEHQVLTKITVGLRKGKTE